MSERRTYTIPNLEFDDFMFSMTYTKITAASNRTFSVDFDNIWMLLRLHFRKPFLLPLLNIIFRPKEVQTQLAPIFGSTR